MKHFSMKKVILPLILVLAIAAVLVIRPWHTAPGKADPTPTGQEQVDPENVVPDPAAPENTADPDDSPAPIEPDPAAEKPPVDPADSQGAEPGEESVEDPGEGPDSIPDLVVTDELVIEIGEDEEVGGF